MIESSNTPTGSKTGTELNDGRLISVGAGALNLNAILHVPPHARGLVILASGIEDSTSTPHQDALALSRAFFNKHLASLLVDLFIIEERQMDQQTAFFRHNADIMQQRLIGIADWLLQNQETANFSIGCFGSGTCGAAALIAAAQRPDAIRAVAAAAGRLDLAQQYLPRITVPTLLLAPEKDSAAVQANQQALEHLEGLTTNKQFEQVPGVSSLFETSNALTEVARVTSEWFARWLIPIV
ncbi:MAG TPA: CocE/NonD family hydrolase [Ktedonosporobacter sp.]|jgi:dienelactone hydrolase|nr:CocE/NonD family hydrolase [Ktedonosporobacter sp.]